MKQRLDILLAGRGLVPSRETARRVIMSGVVYVDGQKCDKPGQSVSEDADVEVRGGQDRYVSRGGYKLEKAMQTFPVSPEGGVCMDIGASTGGFTDCMLQNGAVKVYAVDVGYGQLAWKLREDERVVNLERTNVRYLPPETIAELVDLVSIDVSFISLTLVLPVAVRSLAQTGDIVALIKPQFEAGREHVGKKGVVRDAAVHVSVVEKICTFCAENGMAVHGLTYSPIKGPQGNIEYLAWIRKADEASPNPPDTETIRDLVRRSHEELDGGKA